MNQTKARAAAEGGENEAPRFTLDDQIALIPQLRNRNDIAKQFGYASDCSLRTTRFRGRLIPQHRLNYAAARFEALALALREMARAIPRRKRVTKIRPELYADLGLVLGDEEAKPR